MLCLPNYSEDSFEVKIMKQIALHPQNKYFITVEFSKKGESLPLYLQDFLTDKSNQYQESQPFTRVYREGDWRLILTFIPRNKPIDRRFALTNTFVKLCQKQKK